MTKKIPLKKSHKEIIDILSHNCGLNAYEIFEMLKSREIKNISQTTVYRALNYLVDNYILKPVNLNDGHTRYEVIAAEEHHHHFICTHCRCLVPIECPYNNLESLLPEGFQARFHNFEIFGLCKNCVEGKETSSTSQCQH
jgi:Fur family zinc uptake transcriptional regulator